MGGYGSGNFNERYDKRGLTSEHRQLDSFSLMQALRLMKLKNLESHSSTINWPGMSKAVCRLRSDRLEIAYNHEGKGIKDAFQLVGVPNYYGGRARIYFICPKCNRRSRLLYLITARFKCRKCAKLNYESQRVGRGESLAAMRVMTFMWSRFKCSPPTADPNDIARHISLRPKGMHRARYERLLKELTGLQRGYVAEVIKRQQRIEQALISARDGLSVGRW